MTTPDDFATACKEMRDAVFSSSGIPRRFITGELTMEESFLAAILANPAYDTPRLIYADWLEEHGQGERAEFIRIQIELARLEIPVIFRRHEPLLAIFADAVQNFAELSRVKDLRRRERELLDGWTPAGDVRNWAAWSGDTLVRITGVTVPVFRRGFVAEVTCTLAAWMEHGPAIVRAQPVEVVRVSDREPWNWDYDDSGYGWWADVGIDPVSPNDKSDLPKKLFELLPQGRYHHMIRPRKHYDSPEAAHAALSAGCILYAKTLDPTPTQP